MQVRRLTQLDGLRGLAALAVVMFHYLYRYDELYQHEFAVADWLFAGYYGVNLFFMISGFVIYWTLLRCERPLDFIWSRFSRLYPLYWAALFTTFGMMLIFGLPGRERDWMTLLVNLSMVQEYLGVAHMDGVYWTLTLELAFYFWMLMIFALGWVRHIEVILMAWVAAALVLTYEPLNLAIPTVLSKLFVLEFIEFFAAGVCFYQLRSKGANPITLTLLALTVLALFAEFVWWTALALVSFYVLFWQITQERARWLSHPGLVYLGALSYGLYLLHQNIGYVVINHAYDLGAPGWLGVMAALLVSWALAHGLMIWVERPSLKFLRGWQKRQMIGG